MGCEVFLVGKVISSVAPPHENTRGQTSTPGIICSLKENLELCNLPYEIY